MLRRQVGYFMKKVVVTLLLLSCIVNSGLAQTESLSSKFYFPGSIGLAIPSGDEQTSMRSGFALNTGFEYRPTYVNALFFRFNYDNVANKYSSLLSQVPTNVTTGKLNSNFFMLGMGYRRKVERLGIYAIVQPGYNVSTYNTAVSHSSGVELGSVSAKYFAVKAAMGLEYYIVPHFALVIEPAYYHNFKTSSGYVLNPNYLSYSIGFTTTLF